MDASEARRRLTAERRRLAGLRDEALATRDDAQRSGGELSTLDQHAADAATDLHDREVTESVLRGLDAELAEVEDALARVQDGTYGRCHECGEPIEGERLEALPATRFCARHQPQVAGVRPRGSRRDR